MCRDLMERSARGASEHGLALRFTKIKGTQYPFIKEYTLNHNIKTPVM